MQVLKHGTTIPLLGTLQLNKSTTLGPVKFVDSAAEPVRLEADYSDLTLIFCELGPFEDQNSFPLFLLD